ncbi:MAG: tyrosine-type recombinase/integrase [Bavariicoccus seileri]|uniref:tyrosine-type recombinase/integrase n=1 Tax=Bavariicoccus seileri TaxID=549685 RepID=UPI003F9CA0FB
MASVIKRGSKFQYEVSYKKKDGSYEKIRKSGFINRNTALSHANKLEENIKKGYQPEASELFFSDYFKSWMELYKKTAVTDITYRKYVTMHHNITKYFKYVSLGELDREVYQKALNKFAKTHNVTTTKQFHKFMKSCLRYAFEDRVILKDPTFRAVVSGANVAKPADEKYLNLADFKRLIAETSKRLSIEYASHYAILIAALTGCRFSEVLGLTWENIDYNQKSLRVEKTWSYKLGGGFAPTKNKEKRTIDIDDTLIKLFKDYHILQKENNVLCDSIIYKDLSSNAVNKTLKSIQSTLDINNPITFHGLRHTHASVLLYNKIDLMIVSERLGHKNYSVTQDTYSHIIDELRTKQRPEVQSVLENLIL